MKGATRIVVMNLLFTLCLLMVTSGNSWSEEYNTLKGLETVKAVFDFELGNPQSALIHLQVIQQTFKDKNMWVSGKKPEVAIIFIGPSVKLVSKSRIGFNSEDEKTLDQLARTITEMSNDGIKMEICLIAVKLSGIEPSSILPEIKQVGNGWISLIGHEAKGYSLVPVNP
jgi:intracellular sulfur oxidation DsrE/DsrF family protein